MYRVHAVAHAIPETPVNSRRRRRSEYALTFRHSITNARKKHPLDARLEFLPRAPNARATPKLPSRKPTRLHPPNRQCSRRKEAQHLRFSSRRARYDGPFVVRHSLHLICSTDRPGGRDCLSLFALLASSTHSVYKYFEQRTLNLVTVPVFLIFTLFASLLRGVRRKSLISLICLGCC